jgi:hypothetical protein
MVSRQELGIKQRAGTGGHGLRTWERNRDFIGLRLYKNTSPNRNAVRTGHEIVVVLGVCGNSERSA